jgi:hypothetical protein
VDYNRNYTGIKELFQEEQKEVDCEDEYRPEFSLREFLRKGLYEEDEPGDNERPQAKGYSVHSATLRHS